MSYKSTLSREDAWDEFACLSHPRATFGERVYALGYIVFVDGSLFTLFLLICIAIIAGVGFAIFFIFKFVPWLGLILVVLAAIFLLVPTYYHIKTEGKR